MHLHASASTVAGHPARRYAVTGIILGIILGMPALRLPHCAVFAALLLFAVPLFANDHPKKYAGQWKGETYSKGETRAEAREGTLATRHHTLELSLGDDGTATVTQSPDAVSETTSFAHWSVSGNQLTLTFDAPSAQASEAKPDAATEGPAPLSFAIGHGELTPLTWDHRLWKGQGPPTLHRP